MIPLLAPIRNAWFAILMIALSATSTRAQVDEHYARIAEALASPIYFDVESARNSHADTTVMLRMEIARQRLMEISPSKSDLLSARSMLLRNLDACHSSMENLRRLNQYVPDVEGLAKRTIFAAPGLYKQYQEQDLTKDDEKALGDLAGKAVVEVIGGIVNAYNVSTERTAYQEAYLKTRTAGVKAISDLCSDAYRSTSAGASLALAVEVDGSWNNTFSSDWVKLRNDTGRDLTHCTFFVSLAGTNAKTGSSETDGHVHYLAKWPAGKWTYAPYPSRAASGIATNESVDSIDKIQVTLLSDQASGTLDHPYVGAEHDDDVRRWVTSVLKPKFSGSWYNYTNHTFYDNGFELSYEGELSSFPASSVTVKITEGSLEKSLTWNLSDGTMSSGFLGKRYLSDARFNGWNPDRVEVTISFPKSSYQHALVWNLK